MKCHYTTEEIIAQRKRVREYAKIHLKEIKCGCKDGVHYVNLASLTCSHYNSEVGALVATSFYECPRCGYHMTKEYYDCKPISVEISKY